MGGTAAGYADGIGTSAMFKSMLDVALDVNGNIYAADGANHLIRKVVP